MTKSLFYRLFGVGKISVSLNSQLQTEGILASDEGLRGSVTYINFRRPGMVSSWRRKSLIGALVLTRERFLALSGYYELIDVPLTDERIRIMKFSVEKPSVFCVSFDPSLFHPDWSGTIEYRFQTDLAGQFVALIQQQSV